MKQDNKKESGLTGYLKPLLDSGDPVAIAQARKEYRRRYKAAWRKAKRKTQKTFEISFSKEEWKIIRQTKQKQNRSYTNLIKASALAYCEKKYLVPDQLAYNTVCQALQMVYNKLKDIEECNMIAEPQSDMLFTIFSSIENAIEWHLKNPQTLEETICETIRDNPLYKLKILQLLQTLA